MTSRNWAIVGIICLILVGSLWMIGAIRNASTISLHIPPTPTPSSLDESVVAAKGNIVPAQYARLSFGASGNVAQVFVREGDSVKSGDPIAQLDTSELLLQVQSAQDTLDVANATLSEMKAPASPDEIAAAEATYRSAQANYDKTKNGASGPELSIAMANLGKAAAAAAQAQAAYDRIGGASNPDAGMLPQSLALQQATQDYQIAKANYELKIKGDSATLASAEAALYGAQAELELKKNGLRPTEITVQEARIKQAQTTLAQSKVTLSKATLAAPFDGTMTNVTLRQGESVNAGAVIATIADISRWRIETTDLDEWGAGRVKIAQAAKVTSTAFPNKVLTAKVISIARQSVLLSTGDTAYVVTLLLDQADPELRWGMTAKIEFQKP